MSRLFQIVLLIAAMLVCPLNCSAHAAASGATSHKCGCQHCQCSAAIDQANGQHVPEGGETASRGCVCHGALLAGQAPRLDLDTQPVAVAAEVCLSHDGTNVLSISSVADTPPLPSGRDLRLSHLSLLL